MTRLNVTHKDDFWYRTEDRGDSFDRQMEHTNLKESLKDAFSIAKTLSEANSTLTKTNATLTKQIETHTHAPPATSLPPPPPLSPDSNYPTVKDSIHNPKNHDMPDSYAQVTRSTHLIPIKPTRKHFLAPRKPSLPTDRNHPARLIISSPTKLPASLRKFGPQKIRSINEALWIKGLNKKFNIMDISMSATDNIIVTGAGTTLATDLIDYTDMIMEALDPMNSIEIYDSFPD